MEVDSEWDRERPVKSDTVCIDAKLQDGMHSAQKEKV